MPITESYHFALIDNTGFAFFVNCVFLSSNTFICYYESPRATRRFAASISRQWCFKLSLPEERGCWVKKKYHCRYIPPLLCYLNFQSFNLLFLDAWHLFKSSFPHSLIYSLTESLMIPSRCHVIVIRKHWTPTPYPSPPDTPQPPISRPFPSTS